MTTMPTDLINGLRDIFAVHFDRDSLADFALLLGIDYGALSGAGDGAKARELAIHLWRQSKLPKLVDVGPAQRPDIDWSLLGPYVPEKSKQMDGGLVVSAGSIDDGKTTPRELPQGAVTFLFTDIVDSTPLWEQYPEAMKTALARHDDILHQSVRDSGGVVVKSTGNGSHAAFAIPADGLNAALLLQRRLAAESWAMLGSERIQVRAGLHTGEAELRGGDYHGPTLNRAERIMSAGHGGQVLLSSATAALVRSRLPADVTLRDLGEHRLRGLTLPEQIFQVGAPGLATDFPPLSVLDTTLGNLPPSLTSFIGRQRELSDIRHMLVNTRLLTLIGVGGTGKTRLSLEVAAERQHAFQHGAWLVELAAVQNPDLVAQVVADAFHLPPQPNVAPEQALTIFLQNRQLLLVLDNCEHLTEPCARLADLLLRSCPGLTILVTSREGLGVPGEAIYPVPVLPLPPVTKSDAATAEQFEAVRLFAERARALKPAFRVTDANAMAIVEIVRRLDGIPLAIELAAARVSLFSPEQIAARLKDRFRLLSTGGRTALARQQTLRAAVDWSYDLLSEEERAMFQRLSVFPGGWAFEAAEAVSGRLDVLELLPSLINKSLVQVDESGTESRYYFLETIREYALERLAEHDDPRRFLGRMLSYYAAWAEANEPAFRGSEQLEMLHRFDAENDNLRVALDWGAAHDPATAARLAAALWLHWFMRGKFREARDIYALLEERLAADGVSQTGLDRARFIQGRCAILWVMSENETTERLAREGIPLFREAGDESGMAQLHHLLAMVVEAQGRPEEARAIREEGISQARRARDYWTLAMQLLVKGVRHFQAGDLETAHAFLLESLATSRQANSEWHEGGISAWLGRVELARDHFTEARGYFEKHRIVAERFNDRRGIITAYEFEGMAALKEGNTAEARRLAETGARLADDIGIPTYTSRIEMLLGDVAKAEGKSAEAREHYERALSVANITGDQAVIDQAKSRLA